MTNIIISDIDGTLSDGSHRVHYLLPSPKHSQKNWDKYYSLMHLDKPKVDVIHAFNSLQSHFAVGVLVTARDEKYREVTEKWLKKYSVQYYKLMMRPNEDKREDVEIKREILNKLEKAGFIVKIVFEDRTRCVKMWREEGLTCFQVAEGDF